MSTPDTVHTEGITHLTLPDVEYAGSWDCVIKLIGRAKKLPDGKILAAVYPALLKSHSQLANIDDVFNGILIRGNATGDVVFYGRGAGKLPTASAVVADMIDISKAGLYQQITDLVRFRRPQRRRLQGRTPPVYGAGHPFGRPRPGDRPGTSWGRITWLSRPSQPEDEVAFVTGRMSEYQLREKLEVLGNLLGVQSVTRALDY